MEYDESVFLRLITDEANRRVKAGAPKEEVDIHEVIVETISSAPSLAPESLSWLNPRKSKQRRLRAQVFNKTRRSILKRFAKAFRFSDEALAVVEIINQKQCEAIYEWKRENFEEKFRPSIDVPNHVGGVGVKCLLLNSLHARSVVVFAEIFHLLSAGFSEAAAARCRTLYELMPVTILVASSGESDSYDLSDRYYWSSVIEEQKLHRSKGESKKGNDPEVNQLTRKLREKYGNDFFEQYGWAKSPLGFGRNRRVTFADLEAFAQTKDQRHIYVELNGSIHVGALNAVQRTDFRRYPPHATRPENHPEDIARIGDIAAYLLDIVSSVSTEDISSVTHKWDDVLALGVMMEYLDQARKEFQEFYRNN